MVGHCNHKNRFVDDRVNDSIRKSTQVKDVSTINFNRRILCNRISQWIHEDVVDRQRELASELNSQSWLTHSIPIRCLVGLVFGFGVDSVFHGAYFRNIFCNNLAAAPCASIRSTRSNLMSSIRLAIVSFHAL